MKNVYRLSISFYLFVAATAKTRQLGKKLNTGTSFAISGLDIQIIVEANSAVRFEFDHFRYGDSFIIFYATVWYFTNLLS